MAFSPSISSRICNCLQMRCSIADEACRFPWDVEAEKVPSTCRRRGIDECDPTLVMCCMMMREGDLVRAEMADMAERVDAGKFLLFWSPHFAFPFQFSTSRPQPPFP